VEAARGEEPERRHEGKRIAEEADAKFSCAGIEAAEAKLIEIFSFAMDDGFVAMSRPTQNPRTRRRIGYDGPAMGNTSDFRGQWALVTGASAGIGAALARELAGCGAKLILTARRAERLESLAAELNAKGTETRIVVADLNDPAGPRQIYDAIEKEGLSVDILVNNAGLGQYGAFLSSAAEQELSQVRVNCEAVVRLSRLFVPRMVERRRGWVLVVASTASFQPVPYLTTYAATKVFDRYFALGLAAEVARFGVKVTALCPGPTESEFFEVAGATVFKGRGIQATPEVARLAIGALARGKRTIIPNFSGRFTAFLVRFLPVGPITYFVEKAARPKSGATPQ
jgi:short-subunit dehydrogenase